MLFNSPTFIIFYAIVFALYWSLRSRVYQNSLLIAASYVFYGTWSWKFLLLLMCSTLFDYSCGRAIAATTGVRRRRVFLIASITANLGLLAIFKYAGFFSREAATFLAGFGFTVHPWLLNIVLPVGLSFYTFQSLGYVIDVYRGKLPAVRNLPEFALYVAFFPQLVAGPIERAAHMLPQYRAQRVFNGATFESGLMLTLWGLFKKMVIADSLAPYVNVVFQNPNAYSGSGLLTATTFFMFQIYGDFSGYSDTARGVARMLGFELMVNFNLPYFSRNPVEFWRRWHISLSQWFQDYLYFPLAMHYMRRGGWASKYKAHIISFVLIGLWHGANWTFITFGLYWGLVIAGYLYIQERLNDQPGDELEMQPNRFRVALMAMLSTLVMWVIVDIGWVMFRADSMTTAAHILGRVFSTTGANDVLRPDILSSRWLWLMVGGLWMAEWAQRNFPKLLAAAMDSRTGRLVVRHALVAAIALFYLGNQQAKVLPFIYFQF